MLLPTMLRTCTCVCLAQIMRQMEAVLANTIAAVLQNGIMGEREMHVETWTVCLRSTVPPSLSLSPSFPFPFPPPPSATLFPPSLLPPSLLPPSLFSLPPSLPSFSLPHQITTRRCYLSSTCLQWRSFLLSCGRCWGSSTTHSHEMHMISSLVGGNTSTVPLTCKFTISRKRLVDSSQAFANARTSAQSGTRVVCIVHTCVIPSTHC